jgi:pyridoxal phosphate enzyme (YggS family)
VNLKENVEFVKERIENAQLRSGNKTAVKIIAITKTHQASVIADVKECGIDSIGENRIQEADEKFAQIPNILPTVTKRLVGHLQSNKINKAITLFDTIDSVDSLSLANKIGNKSLSIGKNIPILLEVNTSGENAKFGFDPENIDDMLACFEMPNIELAGLMTIGPLTSDRKQIRTSFQMLRELKNSIKSQLVDYNTNFKELSMGMSGDFELAIEEGATMVRLGTVLFGQRGQYR